MRNFINKQIVSFAYFLEDSKRYRVTKKFFYNFLENDLSQTKKFFDYFMILLIVSSVLILIYEVQHTLNDVQYIFNDYILSIIFIIEYLLRFWVYNDNSKIIIAEYEDSLYFERDFKLYNIMKKIVAKKWEYVSSVAAIIDLLAILPSYRPLRMLRIFLLFRVFKLLRYTKVVNDFFAILVYKRFELFTLFVLLIFFVFIAAVLIYIYEGHGENPNIVHFFDAVYWALITITTVGFGDITPKSIEGKAVAMVIIITGLGLISFATSIIVSSFNERFHLIKTNKAIQKLDGLNSFYLITGYSSIAKILVKKLRFSEHDIVVIDNNKDKIKDALDDGLLALKGDADKLDTYHKFNLINMSKIKAILCLTSSDIQNVAITLTIRTLNEHIPIITRAHKRNVVEKLKFAGATNIVYPYENISKIIKEYIGKPVAYDAISAIMIGQDESVVDEIKIYKNSYLENQKVKNLEISKYRLILLGIIRDEKNQQHFLFNPRGDFTIKSNDKLILMGYQKSIDYFLYEISKKNKR